MSDFDEGYKEGFKAGHAIGYPEGRSTGYDHAKERSYLAIEMILERLVSSGDTARVMRETMASQIGAR